MEALREAVAGTAWIDTHEHLVEPATRARGAGAHADLQPCIDFALLFAHYAVDDLTAAGMPTVDRARLLDPEVAVATKWNLLRPWWERTRHTGSMRAVAETARILYGVQEWNVATCERISAELQADSVRAGHYADVLRRSGVLTCQVNSLEVLPFCETSERDYLLQDLSLLPLSTDLDIAGMCRLSGLAATDLRGWHEIIDWTFARCGPQAVAVKSQAAYARRLDYRDVPAREAAPHFARAARGEPLAPVESRALQDHLMRYCLGKAMAAGLPVKLHCGFYAGTGVMPLDRVRHNAGDVCALLQDFGDARFVLMHIGYPYQDEYIALAKHYANAYVDLCWAWLVNPAASTRFLYEYLMAAPANKVLCFGGDYATVENVAGHAAVARQGLVLTLERLVADGWLAPAQALELVPRLMKQNAQELFDLDAAGRLRKSARPGDSSSATAMAMQAGGARACPSGTGNRQTSTNGSRSTNAT